MKRSNTFFISIDHLKTGSCQRFCLIYMGKFRLFLPDEFLLGRRIVSVYPDLHFCATDEFFMLMIE